MLSSTVWKQRIPDALLKQIRALAQADRRRITDYIVIVLEDHVSAKKAPKK